MLYSGITAVQRGIFALDFRRKWIAFRRIRKAKAFGLDGNLPHVCLNDAHAIRAIGYGTVRSPVHTGPHGNSSQEVNMRQKKAGAVAFACGLACALSVFAFTQSVRDEAESARTEALARYGGEQVEVCVAARDIAAGERIDPSAVQTRLWVADLLPEKSMNAANEPVGNVATSPVFKGEVFTEKCFAGASETLEAPAGTTALSVPAKAVQAVGGSVAPGMFVDVYASGETSTQALARNVLVLATSVSGEGSGSRSDFSWITIAADPASVQELIAAARKTDLYFTLPAAAGAERTAVPSN